MKKISNILSTLLLIVVVILACIFFVPRLFGIQTMAVLSGSMEPHFHVGSLVFVKDAEITDFEKDDIVTFKIGNGDTVVTHRVTQVTKEGLKTILKSLSETTDYGDISESCRQSIFLLHTGFRISRCLHEQSNRNHSVDRRNHLGLCIVLYRKSV